MKDLQGPRLGGAAIAQLPFSLSERVGALLVHSPLLFFPRPTATKPTQACAAGWHLLLSRLRAIVAPA